MSFVLKSSEQEAWDEFAKVALKSVMSGKPISGDQAAQIAAKFADNMIEERRKRASQAVGVMEML
ncbi:hypothetical protein PSMEN_08235 [Ectopseudomonas mendocina]|nr:hypothetical protein PSMEN_08235 [Pseudomonas mendocina]